MERRSRGRRRHLAEERKVVTSLFCDLVGFTATSESADPEDVGRMLAAYFAMARAQIESHGGVVEKFIGDAVVGVFGVPAAHEDDPERAVRAALRIAEDAEALEAVGGTPLRLRIGINTGEALVRLGITPGSGEGFLAGDAINTASRLQSVAPEMGVAVGLATYEATAQVFDYRELEPATLKGKTEPVRVFHALRPRARMGTDLTRTHDTPFIGREIDLALLKGIFDKTVAAQAVQLVTVVGEPGLGKTRIVAELATYIDARPDLVIWRQGRCMPYGEGITFWALGEILKAHAGILESDAPDLARTKLDAVLPEGSEREWFRQRLLPLLGHRGDVIGRTRGAVHGLAALPRTDRGGAPDRAGLRGPALGRRRDAGLPGARRRSGRGRAAARRRHLAPGAVRAPPRLRARGSATPPRSTCRRCRRRRPRASSPRCCESAVIPAELQQPILDRAGGNPLYAEEFVRLLKDRGLLVASGLELGAAATAPRSRSPTRCRR